MCTVVGREGMLHEGLSGFEVGVGGARGGEVVLMCLLCGIGGMGGRDVGVGGVEWVMCWECCVVRFFVVMVGCAGMWCALGSAVLRMGRVCIA